VRAMIERIIRFHRRGVIQYGRLNDDVIELLDGDLANGFTPLGEFVPTADYAFASPVYPRKVVGVGANHPISMQTRPLRATMFSKASSALVASGAEIRIPSDMTSVIAEAEAVVVIGASASRIAPSEASLCVAGVLIGNDITGLPVDMTHLFVSKASDAFAPIGAQIIRGLPIEEMKLAMKVNGREMGEGSPRDLYRDASTLISELSEYMTLEPGDLLFTGAVVVSPPLFAGDTVEVEIVGFESITNSIV